MNRAMRRRQAKLSLPRWASDPYVPFPPPEAIPSDADMAFQTVPGCMTALHRAEFHGAVLAWAAGARWSGWTEMDCGCRLRPLPLPEDGL